MDVSGKTASERRLIDANKLIKNGIRVSYGFDNDGVLLIPILDFHHIDPKQKKFTIASKTSGSMDDIEKEIQKCVCLCRNCHAEFHHFYGMSPESPIEAINEFLSNKL